MTIAELRKALSVQNILPIPVEGEVDPDECEGYVFDGCLEEFTETLNQLNISSVFICSSVFSEEQMTAEVKIGQDEWSDSISVAELYPPIIECKEKIGQPYAIRLIAVSEKFELNFYHIEAWWSDLSRKLLDELEALQHKEKAKADEIDRRHASLRESVIDQIKALADDKQFLTLKTQIAMLAYIEDHISDSILLEENELKHEVQKLCASLSARGKR